MRAQISFGKRLDRVYTKKQMWRFNSEYTANTKNRAAITLANLVHETITTITKRSPHTPARD
jgi:hypothetical protein